MANSWEEKRPVMVQLPGSVRAFVSGYSEKAECLEDLTTLDLVQQVRGLIGDRFYPSWAPVVDHVQIRPSRFPAERVNVHFVIGTVQDLLSFLRLHVNPSFVSRIDIRAPEGDEMRVCIFVIGACRVH